MLRWGNVKNAYSRHIYNTVSSISKAELHRIPTLKRKLCVRACARVCVCARARVRVRACMHLHAYMHSVTLSNC